MRLHPAVQQTSDLNWLAHVTALAALVTAICAVVGVIGAERRTRRQLGVQSVFRLRDRWDGSRLGGARLEAARRLLVDWDDRDHLPGPALELLNVFEQLAYLVVRAKTLSLADAWFHFGGEVIQWWYVFRLGIERFQRDDPTVYEDLSRFVEMLIVEESTRRRIPRELLVPSDEDLRTFLRRVIEEAGDLEE